MTRDFSVGDKVRVEPGVELDGMDWGGLEGTVTTTWVKCEVDPHCCCAELGTEGPIRVDFVASNGKNAGRLGPVAMYSGAVVYGAKNQSRCLAAVCGDHEEGHRFLVGAAGLREQPHNELLLLEYFEDTNNVKEACTYRHPGEIWHISPSPRDAALCFTSSTRKGTDPACTLWRLPLPSSSAFSPSSSPTEEGDQSASQSSVHRSPDHQAFATSTFFPGGGGGIRGDSGKTHNNHQQHNQSTPMEAIISLPTITTTSSSGGGRVRCVLWSLGEEAGAQEQVLAVDEGKATLYSLSTSSTSSDNSAQEISSFILGGPEKGEVQTAAWDPHNLYKVATVQGTSVTHWDLRTGKPSGQASSSLPQIAELAHRHGARDVDFNRSKPYYFVTGGEDRLVKFWDSRKMTHGPVKQLAGHTHWVTTVKYNPCHDQLLLSGGTDSMVNLWRVSSISSAPLLDLEDGHDAPDLRVKKFEDHEESVYSVAWSSQDPFVFSSLSYDGRVAINAVPPSEKYKILL
ncbi:tssc1 [Nannochloropsis oceanica]